jgi:hypothetical protein
MGGSLEFPNEGHIQWGGMSAKLDPDGAVAKTTNEQCPANYLLVSPKSVYFADVNGQKIDSLFSIDYSSISWFIDGADWEYALYGEETTGGKKMFNALYGAGDDESYYVVYINGPNVTEIDMEDYVEENFDGDFTHPVGPYAVNYAFGFYDLDCDGSADICDGSAGEKYVVFVFEAVDQDGNPPKKVKDNVFTFKDPEMTVEVWEHYLIVQEIGPNPEENLGKIGPIASIGPNGEMVISVPVEIVTYTPAVNRVKRDTDRAELWQVGWEVKLPQCGSNDGSNKMAAGVLVVVAVFSRLLV